MSGNSHQRRLSARHWRHVYHIENTSPLGIKAWVIRQWCEEQYGKKNFARRWAIQTAHEDNLVTRVFVAFNKDKDAAWFVSRWVE